MQFANVNSKPSEDEIFKVFDHRSSIQLGNISKYITRYSFFKLQVRSSSDSEWIWLKPSYGSHSGLFCVKGNTPEFQFNYIRIDHPSFAQYQYRFLPWPGNDVIKTVEKDNLIMVCLLNANGSRQATAIHQFKSHEFTIKFAGRQFET